KPRLTTCQQPRYGVGGERCPELLGVKRPQAVWRVGGDSRRLNCRRTHKTAGLEGLRGTWKSGWSGEMRRDPEEHQRRRQCPGRHLTLGGEGQGSERD